MRVLLTRATRDAARTRAALEAKGHRVLVSPVIDIASRNASWPNGVVDGLLATSGHAFAGLAASGGPTPEARRMIPLWLVGGRTELTARHHGFEGPAFVAPNAVTLAFAMGKHRHRKRYVYLAGHDRKPDLETALQVTEQTIEVLEVYEARPAERLDPDAVKAIEAGKVDAVLHYSRRSATLFSTLANGASLPPIRLHVCLSDDVADPLSSLGWRTVVAERPDETSLIAALERLQDKQF